MDIFAYALLALYAGALVFTLMVVPRWLGKTATTMQLAAKRDHIEDRYLITQDPGFAELLEDTRTSIRFSNEVSLLSAWRMHLAYERAGSEDEIELCERHLVVGDPKYRQELMALADEISTVSIRGLFLTSWLGAAAAIVACVWKSADKLRGDAVLAPVTLMKGRIGPLLAEWAELEEIRAGNIALLDRSFGGRSVFA